MGQIFALLAPKDSISSKYRGCELTCDDVEQDYANLSDDDQEEDEELTYCEGESDRVFAITRYRLGSQQLSAERNFAIQDMLLYEDQYSQYSSLQSGAVDDVTMGTSSNLSVLIKTENSN